MHYSTYNYKHVKHEGKLLDYYITDCGKLWSIKSHRFLKANLTRLHYLGYKLYSTFQDKPFTLYAHRLVAEHFIQKRRSRRLFKLEVNHKDSNKENNHISNLEWVTPAENIQHYWETAPVFSVNLKEKNGDIITTFKSVKDAADFYKVQGPAIRQRIYNKTKVDQRDSYLEYGEKI